MASITPNSGTVTGGTSVTINGSYLSDASAVTFDGVGGTRFTIDSDTQITAVTRPHAVGLVDVIVTMSSVSATVAGGNTYFVEPTFEFTPQSGDLAEGKRGVDEVYSQFFVALLIAKAPQLASSNYMMQKQSKKIASLGSLFL
ncbi:IPT/TIG domain-containing protein [Hyphococcus sp. DH-69]|uniref:IPT/TIG domain-containing protein n=1 Tax=Hyphococcus formosus TaxID=3143534 RepID=UPI00398A7CE2